MKIIYTSKNEEIYVDDIYYEELNKYLWHLKEGTYAIRSIDVDGKSKFLRMHRIILEMHYGRKLHKKEYVDHINLDKRDNRLENLRICDASQNIANQPKRKDNTSGYKGVYLDKRRNKWCAEIKFYKKKRFLGYFMSPEEAREVYKKASKEIHKEFSRIE
jgi:hypothetical protein